MNAVTTHLDGASARYAMLTHDPVYRATDRARALRVPADLVAKAVLLRVGWDYALAIVPAPARLSMPAVHHAFLAQPVALATEEEIVKRYEWCDPGALPALPDLLQVPGYVDRRVLNRPDAVIAAGVATQSVELDLATYLLDAAARHVPLHEAAFC